MPQDTFVNHRNFLWFWTILFLVAGLIIWYVFDQPVGGKSGSTFFGYTSGILAAASIYLLAWYGIRKRSYSAHRITLKGWLAFHIWLGLALIIIVPLHAAFEFDYNVHTYTYVAMCLVVISGMLGTYFYRALPMETISNRGGGALSKRYKEIEISDKQISDFFASLKQSANLENYRQIQQIFDINLERGFLSNVFMQKVPALDPQVASEKISNFSGQDHKQAVALLALLANKRNLVQSIAKEKTVLFKLKAWLFLHIPFTIILLVLLFVHIISVFYFR